MKKLALALVFSFAGFLMAHEFWLEPYRFQVKKGESVNLRFLVGENFDGSNWKGTNASVEKLKLYYAGVEDDLKPLISEGQEGDSLSLQFFDDGSALVAYESANKHIEIEAARFHEYLKEDGLANALEYRLQHGEADSMGRENYKRCAKTLFQVGSTRDEVYKRQCGMPLEFIALQHPYSMKKGQSLTFRLLYKGQPDSGALVKIWHRVNGKTEKKEMTTDRNGEITTNISASGKFMLSAVKIERTDNESNADWQSFWASYTFGY